MGLGGYLTWTAVAREIFNRHGIKSMPFEMHNGCIKLVKSPIFYNNPHISQDFSKDILFPLQLNNPESNYCKKDMPDKAIYRSDKHIISQICEYYNIDNPELKCELFLTDQEISFANKILVDYNIDSSKLIVVEPCSKTDYTVNKKYPIEKWQYVIDNIPDDYSIIQIGVPGAEILDSVINLVGDTTFREATSLISRAELFMSIEGGPVHAATSQNTKAIVVIGDEPPKKLVEYPQNININFGRGHGPCGMKINCTHCEEDRNAHNPDEILKEALNFLENNSIVQ